MEGRDSKQNALTKKKPRLRWTRQLHDCFLRAVFQLGGAYKATPKDIVKVMGMKEINSSHIKSHLQQYRLNQDIYETVKRNASRNSIRKVMMFEANQENDQLRRTVGMLKNEAPQENDQDQQMTNKGTFFYLLTTLKEAQGGEAVTTFQQSHRRDDPILSTAGLQADNGSSSTTDDKRGSSSESKFATNDDRPFDLNI